MRNDWHVFRYVQIHVKPKNLSAYKANLRLSRPNGSIHYVAQDSGKLNRKGFSKATFTILFYTNRKLLLLIESTV